MHYSEFFDHLWRDYVEIAPGVEKIHQAVAALERRPIVNDHVAFRTFDLAPVNLASLEKHLLPLGYRRLAPYNFKEKKLSAYGYVHEEEGAPRVFLSELRVSELSSFAQQTIAGLVSQVDSARVERPDVFWAGPLWKPVEYEVYEKLAAESEYAGWVAALGFHANHFTISVNALESMETLEELLDFVEGLGFSLNTSGGRVKGTPAVLLEQGSTLASMRPIEFAGGRRETIPTCYYEFARRYTDPATGKLYDGFVAASADKIFESTDRRKG